MAISYALLWEEREYWRVFTASFSHVDLLHIFFNLMSTRNLGQGLEQLLGTFRFLCWVRDAFVTLHGRRSNSWRWRREGMLRACVRARACARACYVEAPDAGAAILLLLLSPFGLLVPRRSFCRVPQNRPARKFETRGTRRIGTV